MTMRLVIGLVLFFVTFGACADSHHQDHAPQPLQAAASGEGNGRAGGPSALPVDARVLGDPGSSEETQVWIGELWTVASALCDPSVEDARYAPGETQRVVLVLEPNTSGERSGRIQFGVSSGRLPESPCADASDPNCDERTSFWHCSRWRATAGFEYTLFDARWTVSGLGFNYVPNYVWNHWCATTKPTFRSAGDDRRPSCVCESGACVADTSVRDSLTLTATRDTLEGFFSGAGSNAESDAIRLRRVR
jgi:hypothetical protein